MIARRFRWAFWLTSLALVGLAICITIGVIGCGQRAEHIEPLTPKPDSPAELTLADSQREHIWQIEHHGNLLTKHGFGAFKKALIRADAKSLATVLSKDFTGAVYDNPREVRLSNDFLQVVRQQEAGNRRVP